jgi:gliding motility-associated-like protein
VGDRLNISNVGNTVPSQYHYVLHGATDILQNQNQISGVYQDVGKYRIDLTIDPNNNCSSVQGSDSVEVHKPIAEILLPPLQSLCKNQRIDITNSTNNNYTFDWQPSLWQNEGISAWGIINDSANIYLKVTDPYNCVNSDTASIHTINCCSFYVPNAFTPNQDGNNDWFNIQSGTNVILEDFRIMNRYGEIIFRTSDINKGWDGSYRGKLCDHGTYFYFIKYSCDGVTKEVKGDIGLIR